MKRVTLTDTVHRLDAVHAAGDTVEFDDGTADQLVANGRATYADDTAPAEGEPAGDGTPAAGNAGESPDPAARTPTPAADGTTGTPDALQAEIDRQAAVDAAAATGGTGDGAGNGTPADDGQGKTADAGQGETAPRDAGTAP